MFKVGDIVRRIGSSYGYVIHNNEYKIKALTASGHLMIEGDPVAGRNYASYKFAFVRRASKKETGFGRFIRKIEEKVEKKYDF